MPSHSKITCKKIFRGLLCVIPFRCLKLQVLLDWWFRLPLNRPSRHLLAVCPSVASRNPFAPFLDPIHVLHVRSFWLSWTPYEDRRWSCGNILRNSLLIPCFTVDRPSRILRSVFTYPWISSSSKVISPFLALRPWPFFEQEHRACGKQRNWQNTNTYPISMVRFLRFLSSPSSLCRRLPSTSTAVWMTLFSSANISAGSFFSLDAVMSPPASTTSTSTAVWVPLWFKYDVFFSISYYFPLYRFAGMPLRFLSFSFTWGLPSSK